MADGWTVVQEAPSGWTPVQGKPEHEQPGFWQRTYENSGLQGIVGKVKELYNDPDKIESLPYDLLSGAANAQVNQGKQAIQSAKQGNTSEAIGHGVASITPFVGPMAAETGAKLGTDVGSGNYKGAAGDVAGFGSALLAPKVAADMAPGALTIMDSPEVAAAVKAAAKELPKAAIKRIPYFGKVGADVAEAAIKARNSARLPKLEPDATSARQNYAGENYGPMDKPKVGGEPDATSENTPNAGEEWFKEPPDATASNKPYAGEERIKPKASRDATGENKPYAGEKIVENDATPQNKDYAGENWSKKPTSISQVAKPDVDTAAYMQAVKENGGKIDASVSGRALEIKKSWAAQSPKAQASIPTPATVEPSPSSEAYQEAPTPEGTRVPGENEDLTNLLTKSVEKAKAPEYDDATIAEARRQLTEQGYDPDHIELALQSLTGKAAPEPTVAPRARVEDQMGMSVDEQFRNHPAGPQPPFPQAAYEKALAGSDAIKSKLSSLKGVKVPRQADLTPEEIGALMRKFHGMRTQF